MRCVVMGSSMKLHGLYQRAVWLVFLMCISVVSSAPHIEIPFGSLMSSNSPYVQAVVQLALEQANNASLVGMDSRLGIVPKLVVRRLDFATIVTPGKTFSYSSAVPHAAVSFLTQIPRPWMVIGPALSSVAVTSVLEVAHITTIAPSAVTGDRLSYPFMTSTDVAVATQGPLLAHASSALGWKRFAVLYNAQYSDIAGGFTSTTLSLGGQVLSTVSFIASDSTNVTRSQDLSEQIGAIKASGARIIVLLLFQADVLTVFRQLRAAGLTGAPYGCVGNNEWLRYLYSSNVAAEVYPALQGCVGTAIGLSPNSIEYRQYLTEYNGKCARDPASMGSCPDPPILSQLFANTVFAVAHTYRALYATLDRCGGSPIYAYDASRDTFTFVSVNLTGWKTMDLSCEPFVGMDAGTMLNNLLTSPAVTFNSLFGEVTVGSDGTRAPSFQLINIPTTDGQITNVGTAYGTNNISWSHLTQARWPGGGTGVPADAIRILYDGLLLDISFNAVDEFVAALVAFVGTFVAALVLEDPILHARLGATCHRDHSMTIASALIMSVASIWPTFCIALNQVSLGPGDVAENGVRVNPVLMFTVWLLVWLLIGAAFAIKLAGMRRTARKMSSRVYVQGDNNIVGETSVTINSTSSSTSTAISAASTEALATTVTNLKQCLIEAITSVDVNTIIAALLVTGALVVMEVMGGLSLTLPAIVEFDGVMLATGVITAFASSSVAVQLQMHLKMVQWTACLFWSLAVTMAHHFLLRSLQLTWTMERAAAYIVDSHSAFSVELLMIVSIIIAAVCCFALILVQFYTGKATSQGWLRQLQDVKGQLRRVQTELETSKIRLHRSRAEMRYAHQSMLLINLNRPHSNTHMSAYAWALTQRVPDQGVMVETSISNVTKICRPNDGKDESVQSAIPTLSSTDAVAPRGSYAVRRALEKMAPEKETFLRMCELLKSEMHPQAMPTPMVGDPDLITILQDPFAVELLRPFMVENRSEESLVFCQYAQLYRAEPNPDLRAELGCDMLALFFQPGAPFEVNVPGTMRDAVNRNVLEGRFDKNLFTLAESEVMALIQVNVFRKFQSSPTYRLFVTCMSHLAADLRSK